MIEPEHKIYWISHGASLIRASFEHVKPIPAGEPGDAVPRLDKAKRGLYEVRSRGTTRFLHLTKTNKRPLTHIETDDEMDEPDDAEPWTKNIGLPAHPTGLKRTMSDPSIGHVDKAAREEADATPMIPTGDANDAGYSPGTPLPDDKEGPGFEDLTIEEKAISSSLGTLEPPSQRPGDSLKRQTVGSGGSHPTAQEIPKPTTTSTQEQGPAPPAEPTISDGETFEQMRQRYDRHETQLYRAQRTLPSSVTRRHQDAPYDAKSEKALQTDVDLLG